MSDRVWTYDSIQVQLLPDDPQGVLRVNIGGFPDFKYCNCRGDLRECIALVDRCLGAMKSAMTRLEE